VKHSNERFQVVQGYLKQDADDGGTGGRRGNPAFSAGRESAGFGLAGWQEVNSRRIQGRQYGAREGIGKRRMEHFLDGLQGFARNDVFDASGYEDVFGVHHAGGQRYVVRASERASNLPPNLSRLSRAQVLALRLAQGAARRTHRRERRAGGRGRPREAAQGRGRVEVEV
jgi:hypothetical protein